MTCLLLGPLINRSFDKYTLFTVKDFVSHWFFVENCCLTLLQLSFQLQHQRNRWHTNLGGRIVFCFGQDSSESCIFLIFLIEIEIVEDFSDSWFFVIFEIVIALGVWQVMII